MTVIDYRGQTFVSIHADRSPTIEFKNCTTDLHLYIAQAEHVDVTRPSVAVRKVNDENFDWFTMAPPMSTIFYTPPAIDAGFPDSVSDTPLAVIFALAGNFTFFLMILISG